MESSVAAPLALAGATAAAASLCLWASHSSASCRRIRAKRPPSVEAAPIFGSVRHLQEPWYLHLYERYGNEPIVVVRYGLEDVFVFQQWQAYKEAMVDNAEKLSGRISQAGTAQIFGDYGGIVSSDGELWREYRRFTLKALRDFGFGRKGGEELVTAEADHLCRSIDAAGGAPLETSALLSTATSNVICQLVFGSRLASEDPRFADILRIFGDITQNSDSNSSNAVFLSMIRIAEKAPWLMQMLQALPLSKKIIVSFKQLVAYCVEHRDRHAADMANVDRARDYIEAHLLHQQSNPAIFNDTRLALAVSDLFIAGTDTTSHTLRWAILFMISHPHVADKVRAEIDDNIGRERTPTMSDKAKLHYTLAVIEEVLRKSCLIPLGVFHRIIDDVTVGEYHLKKDTICNFNVYAIHHDPQLFPQPKEFRPERHLRHGQFVGCEFLSSFGIGKRACLGESLARMELFIFFSSIMQRYTFSLDPEEKKSLWDLTENSEFSRGTALRAPPQHRIVFTRR